MIRLSAVSFRLALNFEHKVEASIRCNALNKMANVVMLVTIKVSAA